MPCEKGKPSRATSLEPRGFQRGPQAPLAVPRAPELAAVFSLPFWPDKKEGETASEGTESYNARGGSDHVPQKRKNKGNRPRRGQDPALQSGGNRQPAGNPACWYAYRTVGVNGNVGNVARPVCRPYEGKSTSCRERPRAAYMRPLQTTPKRQAIYFCAAQHHNVYFFILTFSFSSRLFSTKIAKECCYHDRTGL